MLYLHSVFDLPTHRNISNRDCIDQCPSSWRNFLQCLNLDVTTNCICEIHFLALAGFDLNTVRKLSRKQEKSWRSRDSNLGLLGRKWECFLCATQSPLALFGYKQGSENFTPSSFQALTSTWRRWRLRSSTGTAADLNGRAKPSPSTSAAFAEGSSKRYRCMAAFEVLEHFPLISRACSTLARRWHSSEYSFF